MTLLIHFIQLVKLSKKCQEGAHNEAHLRSKHRQSTLNTKCELPSQMLYSFHI